MAGRVICLLFPRLTLLYNLNIGTLSADATCPVLVKAVVTTFGLVGKRLRESNPGAHLGCEVPLER